MNIKMSRENKLQYLLLTCGLIILVYFILSSKVIENISLFWNSVIEYLFLGLLLSILSIGVKIVRWSFLCHRYKTDISWKDATIVNISGYFYSNITPGKIGDVYKAYFMKKVYDMRYNDGISILFYERFFELLLLTIIGSSMLLIITLDSRIIMALQLLIAVFVVILLAYIYFDILIEKLKKLIEKTRFCEKLTGHDLTISKLKYSEIAVVIFLSFVSLSFEFLRFWLIAKAFGINLDIILLSGFFCISIIIGLVSQIPLGIGVTEVTLTYLVESLGVNSISATSIVLMDRMLSIYFVLIIGFIFSKFSLNRINEVNT